MKRLLCHKSTLAVGCLLLGSVLGYAVAGAHAHKHSGHMPAGHATSSAGSMPQQAGQSAFAAIAEIVEILNRDPETDWDTVRIDQLRDHLVDMSALTLETSVKQNPTPTGVRFEVTGTPAALAAAGRMIPAHSQMLATAFPVQTNFEQNTDSVVWKVETDDPAFTDRLQGLGFYGLMASGAHHQPHHLGIATGHGMH